MATTARLVRLNALVPKRDRDALAEIAAREDRSVCAVVRRIIAEYVARNAAPRRRAVK